MSSTRAIPGHAFISPPSAVSSKHTLYAEILAVTSAMRKNSRWASPHYSHSGRDSTLASSLGLRRPSTVNSPTGQSGNSERDLMLNFQELKREINMATGAWCCLSDDVPNYSQIPFRYPRHTINLSPFPILCDHPLAAVHRTNHLHRIILVALHILVRFDHVRLAIRGERHGRTQCYHFPL